MKLNFFLILAIIFSTIQNLYAQNTYVPDDYFEMTLIALGYDSGELNDSVPTDNIKSITFLDVHERNISDLTGIEDFESLEYLHCYNNNISSIDISNNINLKYLLCENNQITDLDISKNLSLIGLYCGINQLTTLDVSHNSALVILWCYYNNITSLNLESNLVLKELFCHKNEIEELDVSKNVKLTDIWCDGNKLRRLNLKNGNNYYMDVSAKVNPDLFCIQVDNPILSEGYSSWHKDDRASYSEDCSNFVVEMTYVPDDNFEQALIDLGYDSGEMNDSVPTNILRNITELNVVNKNISDLTGIEDFISLKKLICVGNNLATLDLGNCLDLEYFECTANKLISIDLSNNKQLKRLYLYDNNLTTLDLSNNPDLENVSCPKNQLRSLNLQNGNNFKMIGDSFWDGMNATNNPDLTCIQVDDPEEAENQPYWYKDGQSCYSKNCASLTSINKIITCDSFTWIDSYTYTNSNNTATYALTSVGGCDSVVTLDLTILKSTSSLDNQTACDEYVWIDGKTYTESNNTATYILTNAVGCDSIINLDLTILKTTGVDVQYACDSYKWIDGKTYTQSNNSATYTLTNSAGCDSTVTLDLTILNSTSKVDVQTACDSYKWINGKTYYVSNNTATYTLTNSEGCDLVTYLDLTILKSTNGVDTHTACDSYEWIDGKTYTESNNTATHTLTNTAGCDSIITLDLTINKSTASVDTQTVCDSYEWIDGKTYSQSNNTATHTLTNTAGCDSIVTLDLTILNSTSSVDVQTACDSYKWIDGKTYTENNNTATHTLTNVAGCDSTVTLDLNIVSINKSLASNDSTIIAIQENANYQWLDCNNDYSIIDNENSQSFNVFKSGNYAVEISQLGCIDTTDCFSLILVGISEANFNNVKVYPNPNNGIVNINFGGLVNPIIRVLASDGKLVYEQNEINTNDLQFNLEVASGIYFIEIYSQMEKTVYKLVKK